MGMPFLGLMATLALGPTQWVRCQIPGARITQFCLGMGHFGLGGVAGRPSPWTSPQNSLPGQFMPKKRAFWSRIDHYPRFFALFLTSARGWLGHAWARPLQNWPEARSGRRGNTPMSSNRRAFQAQLASSSLPGPQETSQEASQEVLDKIVIFQKKVWAAGVGATYSPSPAGASRPRVTAR